MYIQDVYTSMPFSIKGVGPYYCETEGSRLRQQVSWRQRPHTARGRAREAGKRRTSQERNRGDKRLVRNIQAPNPRHQKIPQGHLTLINCPHQVPQSTAMRTSIK